MTARRMFGEYCLYLDGKPVGLVFHDRLYVKPTAEGRAVAPFVTEQSPFPKARPYLLVPDEMADGWTHREALCRLLQVTAAALPPPQPRKRRASSRTA